MSSTPLRTIATLMVSLTLVGCDGPGHPEARDTTRPAPGARRAELPSGEESAALGAGRWRRAQAETPPHDAEMAAQLEALGYASGTRAPSGSGVTVFDRESASPGLNFYASAHTEGAILMDLEGRVLHEWSASIEQALGDDFAPIDGEERRWWRRAWLFPNGEVLALVTGTGLLRIDSQSRILWARPLPVHHDLAFRDDGGMVVLGRRIGHIPRIHPEAPVVEDLVIYLDAEGREERRFSLLEAFERSPHRELLDALPKRRGDIFHTNSIEIVDGTLADRVPAFRPGRLLVSFRPLDTIALVDPKAESVPWILRGSFKRQHDPQVLPSGRLLVFDNLGPGDRSALVALDPATGRETWRYEGSAEEPFFTRTLGVAQVLPNGNFLITESDAGRAFEVTRAGEIVWEWRSPHRAGERNEFVATLPEMIRVSEDFPTDWLD